MYVPPVVAIQHSDLHERPLHANRACRAPETPSTEQKVRVRELSLDELVAAAAAALALFNMEHPGLIKNGSQEEGAYNVGFGDGAKYICDVLEGKK